MADEAFGRYQLVRELGRGATAETWLARDQQRGQKPIALKRFTREWSAEQADWVHHELSLLSQLSHPYIAALQDYGNENEQFYLSTEYIEGEDWIHATRGVDQNKIIWFALQLLEALDYLYFRNVIHLDLHPGNVLIAKESAEQSSSIKLIDFGLASISQRAHQSAAIGTPPFTAPEFALRRTLDTRSDLYSVGMLLYYALSPVPPFKAEDSVEALNQQLSIDPPLLNQLNPNVDTSLANYVARLIARDPKQRYENPRAALLGLQEALHETVAKTRLHPIPIFEDVQLFFRNDTPELIDTILQNAGQWVIRAESGMGKTFLAQAMERYAWQQQRKVLRFKGSECVLMTPQSGDIIIIDDADEGPVRAWLEAHQPQHCVLLGKQLKWATSENGWQPHELDALTIPEITQALQAIFESADEVPSKQWLTITHGIPLHIVTHARNLIGQHQITWTGQHWQINPDVTIPKPELKDLLEQRLLSLLKLSRIALDAETLATWLDGPSVMEVEALLDRLHHRGEIQRDIESGQITFTGTEDRETTGPDVLPLTDLMPLLEKCYDEGRYEAGLQLCKRNESKELRLIRARLLVGAGHYDELDSLLDEAFAAALNPAEQALVWETRAKSALFRGDYDGAEQYLTTALDLARTSESRATAVRVLLHQGILWQRRGELKRAQQCYEEGLKMAPDTQYAELFHGTLTLNLANLAYDQSDFSSAQPLYETALSSLKKTRHSAVTAQATLNYANLCFYLGQVTKADYLTREALHLAVRYRYFLTQGRALLLLAMIESKHGNPRRQGERIAEALSLFETAGLAFEMAQTRIQAAYYYFGAGQLMRAEAEAQQALESAEDIQASDLAAQARLILGRVLRADQSRKQEAHTHLEAARRHLASGKNSQLQWECEFECAELAREAGDSEQAVQHYRASLHTIDKILSRLDAAQQKAFLRDHKRDKIEQAIHLVEGARHDA